MSGDYPVASGLYERMQNENKAQLGVILAIEDDLQDVELLRLALAQRNCA